MTVTKVVGFDLRIPKHFSLHFYDFYTILYGIYNFAVFENKRKRKRTFASRPLEFCLLLCVGPWSGEEQRREGAAFPGEERLRQWGPHWGKARGDRGLPLEGLGARDGGLQRWLHGEGRTAAVCSGAAALPWRLGGKARPRSFIGGLGRW